jgi:hypothetical protein
MSIVAAWKRKYRSVPLPKAARPNWEMTVSWVFSSGTMPNWWLRKVMPRNIVMSRTAIAMRVFPALSDSGGLKAGMPLLMASTPVRAAQPLEKARRMRKRVSGWVAG